MDLRITPHKLSGTVHIPASKSMAHRAIICAALSGGTSHITGVTFSKDIYATLSVMKALGAEYSINGDEICISGIGTPSAALSVNVQSSPSCQLRPSRFFFT